MEIKKEEYKQHIIEIVLRTVIVAIGSIFASFIALCAMAKLYDLPMRGDFLIYFVSMAAYLLNVIAFGTGMRCAHYSFSPFCTDLFYGQYRFDLCGRHYISLFFDTRFSPKANPFIVPFSAVEYRIKSVKLKSDWMGCCDALSD